MELIQKIKTDQTSCVDSMTKNQVKDPDLDSKKLKAKLLSESSAKLYELGVSSNVFLDPLELVEEWFEKGWTFSDEGRGSPFGWQVYAARKKGKSYDMYRMVANLPRIEDWALIDIETSPDQSEIWCIGVLFQDKYYSFFLETPQDEEMIQQMFTDYLELLNEFQREKGMTDICCYSKTKFDFRVLDRKLEEYGLFQEWYRSLRKHDMYNLMTKYVVFPLSSFGLKSVADFFRYPRELDPNYNGLRAAFDYYNTFGKPVSEETRLRMREKLLLYNEEDTRMTLYIWKKLIKRLEKPEKS